MLIILTGPHKVKKFHVLWDSNESARVGEQLQEKAAMGQQAVDLLSPLKALHPAALETSLRLRHKVFFA